MTKITLADQPTHTVPRKAHRPLHPMTWSSVSPHVQYLPQMRETEYTGKIAREIWV